MRIVVAGHVDHGKSTLIGRLAALTSGVAAPPDAAAVPWAFALDQFEEEQRDGMTIDTTQAAISVGGRVVTLIDVPGHRELFYNMLTGATQADAAVLVVAADEGVREETRCHLTVLNWLEVPVVAVALTKMDAVGGRRDIWEKRSAETTAVLDEFGLPAVPVIPVSGTTGANLVDSGELIPWYDGACFLDCLAPVSGMPAVDDVSRFPVQNVLEVGGDAVALGRLLSGRLAPGDKLCVLPGGKHCTVREVRRFPEDRGPVETGESAGLVLDGAAVSRGCVLASSQESCMVQNRMSVRALWLAEDIPAPGTSLVLRCGTGKSVCRVRAVRFLFDATGAQPGGHAPDRLHRYDFGTVDLETDDPVVATGPGVCPELSRVMLADGGGRPVAAGIVAGE